MDKTQKASKGTVSVESFQSRLRLRLPRQLYEGTQKYLTLNLADTPENRQLAEQKAHQIELDIASGSFDETLAKYKPQRHLSIVTTGEQQKILTISDLWNRYIDYKRQYLKPRTLDKLAVLEKHIKRCPYQDLDEGIKIRLALLQQTTTSQAKDVLMYLSAACKWGIKHGLVTFNPFEGMYNELPKHKWQDNSQPNAFSEEEKEKIIQAFKNHKPSKGIGYSYYSAFVEFLFLTGCRPSEAIGLQWKHITPDCSQITFEGALVQVGNGERVRVNGSKNNKKRVFNCNQRLQELILKIKPEHLEPESLIFPSPEGLSIHYRNFSRRAWDKIVDPLVERQTTPYSCRDTFISEQIAKGVPTAVVAKWCDNSVDVIEQKYLDARLLEQLKPL
ncbi:Arm DNA-binding domain-containing protein [uncultured Nostoc sp.]|uniref:Arm DNA-binding domain-containing protein n=1 Tax=uncultured Nostoc sp. TaxID=340711 RepID=UPI0035CC9460